MRKLTPFLCLLVLALSSAFARAQDQSENDPPLINSGVEIVRGIILHDDEEYKEALEAYDLITRNDTNYSLALAEKAQTLIALEKYKQAIRVCEEGLTLDQRYNSMFYLTMGTAYDEMGRPEQAVKSYREGLVKYPYNQLLYFNLGLTLYNQDKLEESKGVLMQAIQCNQYYASPHFLLGKICAEQGDIIPAMLTLQGFLMREPLTERSQEAVTILSEIAKVEHEAKEEVESVDTELFADMKLIINSKAALNGGYKTVAKAEDPVIRQTQLLFEKLEYKEGTGNFWMDYYVPMAKKLYKDGQIEAFSYWMFASYNAPIVQNWLKKNQKGKLQNFITWRNKNIEPNGKTSPRNDVDDEGSHWYYDSNGKMRAVGKAKSDFDSEHQGDWIYYYYYGNRNLTQTFDEDGNLQGETKLYALEGHLKEVSTYVDDTLHGPNIYYNASGLKRAEGNYVNGKIEGIIKRYYPTGQLSEEIPYTDNDVNGKGTYYYRNGDKSHEIEFKDDEYDGTFVKFFHNGQVERQIVFSEGKSNGPYKSFYDNGQLESEGEYKDDEQFGLWKTYHKNGQLFTEITYDDEGKPTGSVKEIAENGTVLEEYTYLDGKLNGILTAYKDDGKKHYEHTYKKGALVYYKYFNKEGTLVAEGKGSKGKMNYVFYSSLGRLRTQGLLKKGERQGVWKFYHPSGALDEVANYNVGERNGSTKTYFRNGKLRSEYMYVNGDADGYFRRYFSNGKLEREGWYKDNNSEGYWRHYHPNGTLEQINYFLDDDLDGYQQYFHVDGKLDYELHYKDGLRNWIISFDTLGDPVDTLILKNGSGEYMMPHLNATVRLQGTYQNGMLAGEYKWINPKGKVTGTVDFFNGSRHGMYESFYDSGKLKLRGFYDDGDYSGDWRWYHPDGTLETEGQYDEDGEKTGHWKWYRESGIIDSEGDYKEGARNGTFLFYNTKGNLSFIRYYANGVLLGYSYHGKDGKPLPMVELPNETGKIVAYFPNGKKSMEQTFEKGYRNGRSVAYYENGQIYSEKEFVDDDVEGERKAYYEDGTLKESGKYLYDKRQGKFSFFGKDGKLIREEFYLLGERHGDWKYYSADGNVTKVEKYRYDELYD